MLLSFLRTSNTFSVLQTNKHCGRGDTPMLTEGKEEPKRHRYFLIIQSRFQCECYRLLFLVASRANLIEIPISTNTYIIIYVQKP